MLNIFLLFQHHPLKSIKLQVKPHLLYKPGLNDSKTAPDPLAEYNLFDRVVIAKESHSVNFHF